MQKKKLHLIEDIAGAFGGKIGNKYFGGFADFVVGSFGQGKILDMNGGGFLALRNKVIFNKAKLNCALLEKYNYVNKNLNIQIHKIQSGIINKKINKTAFNKRNLKKFFKAFVYNKKFSKQYFKKLNSLICKIDKINQKRNVKADYFEKMLNSVNFLSIKHKKGSVY